MSNHVTSRRQFLETFGSASILVGSGMSWESRAAGANQKLAVDGGEPVRKNRLSARPYGPQFYDEIERNELLDVLDSRVPFRWSRGDSSKVLAFEKEYAAHLGAKFALGVTSGTTALYTAMAALEVGPGDEVILPAWTWYACYDAIVLSGALPVFAEIDESFDIDPQDMERKITPQTKAIMVVHLQGCPCDMDTVLAIARKHHLRVLEDCAQCAGGRYRGKYVGTIGDIGINSFQLSKTITAGEGGAVVTNDPKLFERAFRFHDFGTLHSPYTERLGGGLLGAFAACNFRMNEFTGAVLRGQLKKLETICQRLRTNAKTVREGVSDLPGIKFRKSPDLEGDLGVGVFLDWGNAKRRDKFIQAMNAEGIAASAPGGSVILPTAERIEKKSTIHPEWPSFQSVRGKAIQYGRECCPRTIEILGRAGGVLMDPNFSETDLRDIIKAIRKVYLAMGSA